MTRADTSVGTSQHKMSRITAGNRVRIYLEQNAAKAAKAGKKT
jgi:hypothetical protein